LDKNGFKGDIPEVKGLSPKENIKAWVDRKAFIHNLGHATVAYVGSFRHPQATFIYEVLEDPKVHDFAKAVMLQAAQVLKAVYPNDYSLEDLEAHVEDLLFRFQNKALRDTIFRVGQDVPRKLGPDDRFIGIIRLAISLQMQCDKFLEAMSYAFFFRATDENGFKSKPDEWFDQTLTNGIPYTFEHVCGFDPVKDKKLIEELMGYYQNLKSYEI